MSQEFIVIPNIKVQAANLHTSGLLLGGAPLMAASMFAHHLARQLNAKDEGIIYIHHASHALGGNAYGKFTPAQRRGAVFINKTDYSSKNKYVLSLQPTASCHLHCSLIIKFSSSSVESDDISDILNKSGRLAGGLIINYGQVSVNKSLEKALQKIKTGYVLIDRQDVLIDYTKRMKEQNSNSTQLQAFALLLALNHKGLEQVYGKHHNLSWLSATNLGYALLEPENHERTGVRQTYSTTDKIIDTPHAYAEPLIGLVQYVSLSKLMHPSNNPPTSDLDHEEQDHNQQNSKEHNEQQETIPNHPLCQKLQTFQDNPSHLFWQYQWQSHASGDVFLLTQSN